jgi:hypothetical protein
LRQPERKYELGPSHQQLRREPLEEGCKTLVAHHLGDDLEATLGVVEIPVLNPSLDDIQRSGYDKGSTCTGY